VTSLSLHATLTAAAADAPEPRVAEGIIVPWGRPGRTNLGPKKVHRGAVRILAEAPVIGLYGHDRDRSVSRLIAHEDRDEGLWGRLRIAETPAGDLLLSELRGGVRDGLSVELSELEFDYAGDVTAGRLDAVAHVPLPAYDSARVHALAATLTTDGDSVTDTAPPADQAAAPALSPDQFTQLLAQLRAAGVGPTSPATQLDTSGLPPATNPAGGQLHRAAELQAALATGTATPEMRAALADITNTDLPLWHRPAGIGEELWSGGGYTRRFVPLISHKPLTSWKFGGWRWVNRPEVDDYAGDKAEIPTNEVSVEPVEGTAQRVAGGWDVDRKFRDFGDADFWAGFYAAQAESYAEKTDAICAAAIIAAARDITVDANVPTEYASVNVAQADVLKATALGQAILEDTPNIRRSASFVLMNSADWLGLMDLTNLDLPAFLSMLGVQPGSFQRSPLVPAGSVILGVAPSMTWYELGGGAPIRVEALDVARAGVDSAVYGYCGTLVNRPGGIIRVPLAA
jgi:hypothetical protein